tara:strand:+ start:18285 stop:18647 length:363 start_codon:yes stop_codon:yes gene_type:complete
MMDDWIYGIYYAVANKIDQGTAISLNRKDMHAVVSNRDVARVTRWRWHTNYSAGADRLSGKKPYVRATVWGKKIYLQNFIAGKKGGYHVDHFNRNTLDNRRCNLRVIRADKNMKRKKVRC